MQLRAFNFLSKGSKEISLIGNVLSSTIRLFSQMLVILRILVRKLMPPKADRYLNSR